MILKHPHTDGRSVQQAGYGASILASDKQAESAAVSQQFTLTLEIIQTP